MKNLILSLPFLVSSLLGTAQQGVQEQLLLIALSMASDNYEITHDVSYDNLYDDDSDTYSLSLSAGMSYKIVAVCDRDCRDIDLKIYDENGNQIDTDLQVDAYPIVSISPKWTGRFRLWVKMCDCRINPCRFGIAVFGKEQGGNSGTRYIRG